MSAGAQTAAIVAEGLTKKYKIRAAQNLSLWRVLRGAVPTIEHLALDNVTFTVPRGQSLGIVGRNGAGKSTLLKMLSGSLAPTSGRAITRGSISALLELGSGFNADFTGRQNVYVGGLCMGMTRKEIDERFDSIVAFADLPDVLDRPFRTYSTGMQTRLSFSVAVALSPDIMIVDEALSVGDAKFQARCFRRFEELKARGATILLVSHSMPSIISFCDRAILLENGRLIADGDPRMIDKTYQQLLFGGEGSAAVRRAPKLSPALATEADPDAAAGVEAMTVETVEENAARVGGVAAKPEPAAGGTAEARNNFGAGEARITACYLAGPDGRPTTVLQSGEAFSIVMAVEAEADIDDLVAGFVVSTPKGYDIFGVDFQTEAEAEIAVRRGQKLVVELRGVAWFASNDYLLTVGLAHADKRKIDLHYDYLAFSVRGTEALFTSSVVNLQHALYVDGARLKPHDRRALERDRAAAE